MRALAAVSLTQSALPQATVVAVKVLSDQSMSEEALKESDQAIIEETDYGGVKHLWSCTCGGGGYRREEQIRSSPKEL